MDRLIEQQIFASDVLTNHIQRLQIEDKVIKINRLKSRSKVITLLNELWDQTCINTTARCTEEITCEDGMEITAGELMVPVFYSINEKKFLCQLHLEVECTKGRLA